MNYFKTLDLYFVKVFLSFLVACYLSLILLYFLASFVSDPYYLKTSFITVLTYYVYLLAPIIYFLVAPASLLATLFSFSYFSKNYELIAMQASGLSSYRLFGLVACASLFFGIVMFFVSDRFIEKYFKKAIYIKQVEIQKNTNFSFVQTDKVWYRTGNKVFNIDSFDPQNNVFYGLTLYTLDHDFNLTERLQASICIYKNGQWVAVDGQKIEIIATERFPKVSQFKEIILPIQEVPDDFKILSKSKYSYFSARELKEIVRKHKKLGVSTRYYETQLHAKYSYIFTILLTVFLAIPFAFTEFRKSSYAYNIIICFAASGVFWFVQTSFANWGSSGILYPMLAAWIPNFIFITIAVFVFWKKRQEWQF